MRHGKKFNHLSRKEGHRKALMRNLAAAIIEHKRINTTLAKAKALRIYLEPLVTKARNGSAHDRRVVFGYLQNKAVVSELFSEIAEKVGDRPGGYLRIIKTGFRRSDSAEMAMIEFVDYNDVYTAGKSQGGGGRRRRRRGGSGKDKETDMAATAATTAAATAAAAGSEEEE